MYSDKYRDITQHWSDDEYHDIDYPAKVKEDLLREINCWDCKLPTLYDESHRCHYCKTLKEIKDAELEAEVNRVRERKQERAARRHNRWEWLGPDFEPFDIFMIVIVTPIAVLLLVLSLLGG